MVKTEEEEKHAGISQEQYFSRILQHNSHHWSGAGTFEHWNIEALKY